MHVLYKITYLSVHIPMHVLYIYMNLSRELTSSLQRKHLTGDNPWDDTVKECAIFS